MQLQSDKQLNKFTLKFQDPQLEQLYQDYETKTSRFPTLIILSLLLSINLLVILITRAVNDGPLFEILLTIGALVYLFTSICIVKSYPNTAQVLLMLLSLLLFLFYLQFHSSNQPQILFLQGQNLAGLICGIMFVINFQHAVLSNITYLTLKLVSIEENLIVEDYALTMVAFLAQMIALYWKNHNTRVQYLLALKENKWDTMLPKLIDGSFYIFTLNEEQIRFDLKISTMGSVQNSLFHQFIRESYIAKETLEEFMFRRIQKIKELGNSFEDTQLSFRVLNNKKYISIKYFEYFVTELNFAIVIENETLQKVKEKCEQINKHQLGSFRKFICRISVDLQKCLIKKDFMLIGQLQLFLIECQGRLQIRNRDFKLSHIQPKAIIKKCLEQFPNIQVVILADQEFRISSIRSIFIIMIANLMSYHQRSQLRISISQSDHIEILFQGRFKKQELQTNQMFHQALNILSIKCVNRFDGYMLIIPKNLDISFAPIPISIFEF